MEIPPELVAAKNAVEPALLAVPGVVGVGLGFREENGQLFDDQLAVRIHIADGIPVPPGIPGEIGGVAVSIIPGTITPCAAPDTTRYAELGGGIEVTKPSRGFGTMGAIVRDVGTGQLLGLSCFHVVGGTGDVFPDTIWQATHPPLVVGVQIDPADNVGSVIRAHFANTPTPTLPPMLVGLADAAVFSLDRAVANGRTLSQKIMSDSGQLPPLVPRITATARMAVGQSVRKRGFKTRLTKGLVIGASTTTQWTAGPPNAFLFDQFEITGAASNPNGKFCEQGDSGSVVLDDVAPTAVGLLWGEKLGGLRGIVSSIEHIESQLAVRLVF